MNTIYLNKAHYPVYTLGYGRRAVIWFQGCTLGCRGCVSKDTWHFDQNKRIDISLIITWLHSCMGRGCDGLTLTGGEPFQQPSALLTLITAARQYALEKQQTIDILCYTGYSGQTVSARHPTILDEIDVLIPEPYQQDKPGQHPLSGSQNQPIVCRSKLAKKRYNQLTLPHTLQASYQAGHLYLTGVPKQGQLQEITDQLAEQGIRFKETSWQ